MANGYPIEIKPEYGAVSPPAVAPAPNPTQTPTDPNGAIPVGNGKYYAPGANPDKKGHKPSMYATPEDAYWAAVDRGQVRDPNHVANPAYDGPTDPNYTHGFLRFGLEDPENYANARAGQASAGRDPSIDQRNFQIGREADGANKLRQQFQNLRAEALTDADDAATRSVGYGEALRGDLNAVADGASSFGKNSFDTFADNGRQGYVTALGHGENLDRVAQTSKNVGEASSAQIRSGADAAARSIRGTMARGEPTSVLDQQFGLVGDRAIREAARTGNRAAAADTMSATAAGVARMRADELNTFRNRELDSRVSATGLGIRGSAAAADVNDAGYRGALTAQRAGADTRLGGAQNLTDSLYTGYNTELTGERLAADTRNRAHGAAIEGYLGGADAYAGAMDDIYAGSDLQQAVDELEMRGSVGLWKDDSARQAAMRQATVDKERIEAAKEASYIEAGAKLGSTFLGYV
jgi:hypothetical protein